MRAGGRSGDKPPGPRAYPVALAALGSAYAFDGRFDEAAPILADVLAATRTGPLVTQLSIFSWPVSSRSACLQLGRATEVDRVLAEAEPFAADAEQNWGDAAAPLVVQLRLADARRRYELGDFDTARRRQDHALRLAEISAERR